MRIVGMLGCLFTIGCSPVVVESGTVGVRTRWGAADSTPLGQGLYWRTWLAEGIVPMDTRLQKLQAASSASSKDLQVVTTTIALNWQIDPQEAPAIYQQIGTIEMVQANVIEPILQEAVKTATARFTAEELITKRPEVKHGINEYVSAAVAQSHVVVSALNIVNFEFAPQYQQAIEAKQVAEQHALTATNDLRRIEVEAKQAEAQALGRANAMLIEAKAESERQTLLRSSMTKELVQWEAIRKWDGKLPTVSSDGATLIDLGLGK